MLNLILKIWKQRHKESRKLALGDLVSSGLHCFPWPFSSLAAF